MLHPRRASRGLPHPVSRVALVNLAFLVSLGSRVFRVRLGRRVFRVRRVCLVRVSLVSRCRVRWCRV
ncbi:hypothetical protein, partial [Nocardia sp. Marseille-Q1738]